MLVVLPSPPRIDDAAAAARLRAACAGLEEAIETRLAVPLGVPLFAAGVAHDVALRDKDDRMSVLLRLFVRGTPVPEAVAADALAPATVDDVVSMGLAARTANGSVTAGVRLVESLGLLLASDRGGVDPPPDVVLGDNVPARILAWVTSRRPVGAALDVGTGGGVQALLAAAHAEQVVGVDLSPRALRFAEANAVLNAAAALHTATVEWRQGSWFEPVAGRQFDLILANPPFVISPDSNLLYRDGGFDGDGVTRHVIAEAARHLDVNGLAYINGNWASPLALSGLGCEALVLSVETLSAADYAARWTSLHLASGMADYEAAARRWADHYRTLGIDSITFGVVVLRRRADGAERVRVVEVEDSVTGPCGEHVLRLLDPPAAIEPDGRYRLVEGVRIGQTLTRRDGRYRSHPAVVRLPGLGVKATVDPAVLRGLYALDGSRTLREAATSVDFDRLADAVSVLLHTGLAEPVDEAYRPAHG